MRQIESHRLGSTGEHVHMCPDGGTYPGKTIAAMDCLGCPFYNGLEQKQVSYVVACAVPTSDLFEFEPSHAVDKKNFPDRMGTDPLMLVAHGWRYIAPKLDGARGILHLTADGIRVTLRRQNASGEYTEITNNLPHFKVGIPRDLVGTILDAELMLPTKTAEATGSLGSIMSVVGAHPAKAIEAQRRYGNVEAYVFDCIRVGERDCRTMPYEDRRLEAIAVVGILETIAPFIHNIPVSDVHNDFTAAFKLHRQNLDAGLEGSVLYHAAYGYGTTYGMVKVKQDLTLDALVTGWEFGKKGGKYERQIGALLLSVKDQATGQLREIGKAVPGDDATRAMLTARLANVIDFVELALIVEVEAQVFTKAYRLRHPRILRYRTDRSDPNVVDFTKVSRA